MTAPTANDLGPVLDLAKAIGLVRADQLNTAWFASPGESVGQMLRNPEQRDALCRAVQSMLHEGGDAVVDAAGRRWLQLFAHPPISLHVVLAVGSTAVDLGLGVRASTTGPTANLTLLVPLMRIPNSGAATVLLGHADGRVELDVDVTMDTTPAPGQAGLHGIVVGAQVATDGSAPSLQVSLRGLQLPGQQTPHDFAIGGTAGPGLADEAVRLVLGVVQQSLASASGELSELLSLVGLSADSRLPVLPIADIFAHGASAWRTWLDTLLQDSVAVDAWLSHAAKLSGNVGTVVAAGGPGLPHRVRWTTATGVAIDALVLAGRTAAGDPLFELGVEVTTPQTTASGTTPSGRLALSATLVRVTVGATPSVRGLPSVQLAGHVGKQGERLLDSATPAPGVKVGSLELGLTLGADRKPGLVLAAHNVDIGTHHYDVLDLTNTHTLADVGGAVVGDVADLVLGHLGAAGDAVKVLLGLGAPAGQVGWPVTLTTLPDFLGNPVGAMVGYHDRVIRTHAAGYGAVLDALQGLVSTTVSAVSGTGTVVDPWRLPLAGDVAVVVWADGAPATLHLGLAVDHAALGLGASWPGARLDLRAELVRIHLDGSGGQAVGSLAAGLVFERNDGRVLRLGSDAAAVETARAGLRFGWATGAGFTLEPVLDELTARIDGEAMPFALPTLHPDGTFTGDVPWLVLERLLANLLRRLKRPWLDELIGLFRWEERDERGLQVRLSLEDLVTDPIGTVADLVGGLAQDGRLAAVAERLALTLLGPLDPDTAIGRLLGRGVPHDPFTLPLSALAADAARRIELLLWSPHEPDLNVDVFRPGDLLSWITADDGLVAEPPAERLAAALRHASVHSSVLADLLAARDDLNDGFTALAARWLGSDGLVSSASATIPGAINHDLTRVAHGALVEALDLSALGLPAVGAGTVFVAGPLGPTEWPGVASDHVLDLRAAGLSPDALDVSRLDAQDGPWLVLLASRADAATNGADDGAARQTARLARAVAAVVTRVGGGGPVMLVAHGAAGHAAAWVAATVAGVTHLVTVGTPHGGIGLDVVETQPAAGAYQLLARLLPAVDVDQPEHDAVMAGRAMVGALDLVWKHGTSPLAELSPPLSLPTIPGTVDVHCVRGVMDATGISKAITGVIVRGLQDVFETSSPADDPGADPDVEVGIDVLHGGLNMVIAPDAAPGAVRLRVELAATLAGLGSPDQSGVGFRARIVVDRVGGWLAGGPDPARPGSASRQPSLRRAEIQLDAPFTTGLSVSARIVLHEAEALGVSRRRWVISHTDLQNGLPLMPEAQVLIGRLASSLGPLPASGPIRQLVALLDVIGLLDPSMPAVVGGPVGFSVEGIRRLLVDPSGLLADLRTAVRAPRVAAALTDLLGGVAPDPSTPSAFAVEMDGVRLSADLATGALAVATTGSGLAFAAGATLTGRLERKLDGSIGGQFGVAFGSSGAVLEVSGAPWTVQLIWPDAGPGSIELLPTPDTARLARTLVALVPAELVGGLVAELRGAPSAARDRLDPTLRALGVLVGSGDAIRVRPPLGLFIDPQRWFAGLLAVAEAFDGARLASLTDAVGGLLGVSSGPGTWALPFGLALTAGTTAGRAHLALGIDQPIDATGLRLAGSVGVSLGGPGLVARPDARLVLALPDGSPLTTAGRLVVDMAPTGVAARLIMPASHIDLQLLPRGPGLGAVGDVAHAAVTYALPYVLDAVVGIPNGSLGHEVGVALAGFGDATGLRVAAKFDGAQLAQLVADPVGQLAQRLRTALPTALDALAAVVAGSLPTGVTLTRVGDELVLTYLNGGVAGSVRVSVPVSGPLAAGARIAATIDGLSPFTGALIGAGLTVDHTGLVEGRTRFAIAPASAVAFGSLRLAPLAEIAIGSNAAGGPRLAVGLALDGVKQVAGVLHLTSSPTFALETTGGSLPEVLVDLLVPVLVDLALAQKEVDDLLARVVFGGTTIKQLLAGVVFTGSTFDTGVLDTAQLWKRLLQLAANIAAHTPKVNIDPLTVALAKRVDGGNGDVYGLAISLKPGGRFNLADGETTVDIEVDGTWIEGTSAEGLLVEVLRVKGGTPEVFFGIAIDGIGIRIGSKSGPLLNTLFTVDSMAVHGHLAIDATSGVTGAGGQLELTGLAVPVGSASDSNNKVASGVLRDSSSGAEKPAPKFSPALAVQHHKGGPVKVDLRAGTGEGPWWVTIQRGFGPVYIEQVGFGVSKSGNQVIAARVMVDGKVSLLGLTVAVDDLAVGVRWPQVPSDPPIYSPLAWEVGLAGLAVSSDTGGVVITGGLRRAPGSAPDYVGMISIRFGVYGISAYGGYAVITDTHGDFTSLFIFGALVAPIGGPPAFFVTGLGAGVGVNRLLLLPSDMNKFPSYPLLKALDPNAKATTDPMGALDELRSYFPPQRGAFWFAAGISFTSFALVDGIAVIGILIADGLDVNLLGLARAALPTTAFPLVQIELALLVRFSTRDGVLWIQAQLTDNSWLLTPDCRLTGGFAYVMWFKNQPNGGPGAGEFVLTLGGYHPSFQRKGYPVVPRLGFVWSIGSVLVIKGESYFALTSEAIMAGTRFEAALTLGPLWAYLRLGADGIIYFDPFHFEVTAYAELGAGITIDIDLGWFGHIRITISIHLHADVYLAGPDFHGRATIDLGVTSASISFGDEGDNSTPVLEWGAFYDKYLRQDGARVLTAIVGKGQLPPNPATANKPPTGASASDPVLILPEFVLMVTTTAAASEVVTSGSVPVLGGQPLAIGPMHRASVKSSLHIGIINRADGTNHVGNLDAFVVTGAFPKGVWGPNRSDKPVPTGETILSGNSVSLIGAPAIAPGTVPIDYHQVEIGKRHQLPFLAEHAVRAERAADVTAAAALAAATPNASLDVLAQAHEWLVAGAKGSQFTPLGALSFRNGRAAPPQLLPLTFAMATDPLPFAAVAQRPPPGGPVEPDLVPVPPRVDGLLASTPSRAVAAPQRTSVSQAGDVPRVTPRRIADVLAAGDVRVAARLVLTGTPGQSTDTTVIGGTTAFTGRAGSGGELRRQPGQRPFVAERLDGLTRNLASDGFDLLPGEATIFTFANADNDVADQRHSLEISGGLPARVIALDTVGAVVRDVRVRQGFVVLPSKTWTVMVLGGGGTLDGIAGWHSTTRVAQIGTFAVAAPGSTLWSSALRTRRGGQEVTVAFTTAGVAVAGYSVTTTSLPAGVTAIAVAMEEADPTGDGRADGLELGLVGATRTLGADGEPVPAHVVVSGSGTFGVYSVEPDRDETGRSVPVQVSVASGEHTHLSGVLGAPVSADELARQLAARGFDGLLANLVADSQGVTHIRWLPPHNGPQQDRFQEVRP